MKPVIIIAIAFVLLIPILLVEVESQSFNLCSFELARESGRCDTQWYYDFKVTSTDRYVIHQVYYVPLESPDAYYDRDREIELAGSYETVSWIENIWNWYSSGLIDEDTMSNAFDYIIETDI